MNIEFSKINKEELRNNYFIVKLGSENSLSIQINMDCFEDGLK